MMGLRAVRLILLPTTGGAMLNPRILRRKTQRPQAVERVEKGLNAKIQTTSAQESRHVPRKHILSSRLNPKLPVQLSTSGPMGSKLRDVNSECMFI